MLTQQQIVSNIFRNALFVLTGTSSSAGESGGIGAAVSAALSSVLGGADPDTDADADASASALEGVNTTDQGISVADDRPAVGEGMELSTGEPDPSMMAKISSAVADAVPDVGGVSLPSMPGSSEEGVSGTTSVEMPSDIPSGEGVGLKAAGVDLRAEEAYTAEVLSDLPSGKVGLNARAIDPTVGEGDVETPSSRKSGSGGIKKFGKTIGRFFKSNKSVRASACLNSTSI